MHQDAPVKTQRGYFASQARERLASVEAHCKVLPLPKGAVVNHKGQAVASPELIFLDLAGQLGFHRAVLLGMQLCSASSDKKVPLVTTQKLHDFIGKCYGHHGRKAAAQAVQYVTDNSWSVMESLLFMFLTLPNRYGGFGLTGATLNHEIKLKNRGSGQSARSLYADLYWEQAKLIVEYDSYAFHNNTSSWIKDARRLTALESKGYKVLSVNTEQLYNDQALTEAAQVIAKYLGRRIQIRTSQYLEQKALLRSLLPGRDAVAER